LITYQPISNLFPVLTPERVAKEVVAAIRKNKREVVFPWQLRWAMRMYSAAPAMSQVFMKTCGLWHRGPGHAVGMN
jgi:short-subunit dehydrogenase